MRYYETIFLLKPTLVEDEFKQKIDFFKETVTNLQGEIVATEDIGLKKLAYEVKGHKKGYYFVIYFNTTNYSLLSELQRLYRVTEEVLKFMTIKFVKKKEVKAWEDMVHRAKNPDAKPPVTIDMNTESPQYRSRYNKESNKQPTDNENVEESSNTSNNEVDNNDDISNDNKNE